MFTKQLAHGRVAIVDDEDADLFDYGWSGHSVRNRFYVARRPRENPRGRQYLHRLIAERMTGPLARGLVVDHINGDSLDNRRANLRVVTEIENNRNIAGAKKHSASQVLGVRLIKESGRWAAYICEGRKFNHLGCFATKEEAAAARLAAERDLWGIQPRRATAHA